MPAVLTVSESGWFVLRQDERVMLQVRLPGPFLPLWTCNQVAIQRGGERPEKQVKYKPHTSKTPGRMR